MRAGMCPALAPKLTNAFPSLAAYHAPTGMPYADDLCPHYATRAAAREAARAAD